VEAGSYLEGALNWCSGDNLAASAALSAAIELGARTIGCSRSQDGIADEEGS